MILDYEGHAPQIGSEVFIAYSADVMGQVTLGTMASVWYGCVLRGDVGTIRIGDRTNIQDLTMIHVTDDRFNTTVRVNYLDRDGWLLHQQGRNMTTFQAQQFGPSVEAEYFLSAKQQFKITLQWVGIKAREDQFYRIPESPGDLIEVAKPPGPTDDFSVSQLSFQARYRWEIAPLSDLFVVYTRLASNSDTLFDEDLGELFRDAWENPIADLFTVKLRYRFGS